MFMGSSCAHITCTNQLQLKRFCHSVSRASKYCCFQVHFNPWYVACIVMGSGQFCVNVCRSLGYCSADGFTVASDADHNPEKIMTECSNKKGDYVIDSGLVVTLRTHTRENMGAFACCRRRSWKCQCACRHQEVLIFYICTCCMTEAACINTKPCLSEWTLNLMNSGCKPWKVCTKHAHRHDMTSSSMWQASLP